MKKVIITIIAIAVSNIIYSQQSIDRIINDVIENNTQLIALRSIVEANKLSNSTNIFLSNPEVEYNYLWGQPENMGNRQDFKITQTFEFPTVYTKNRQITKLKNSNEDLIYKIKLNEIALQASMLIYDIVYLNSYENELEKKYLNARLIKEAYDQMLAKGETNIIEKNKAHIFLLNTQNELDAIQNERNTLMIQLQSLNGGKKIIISDSLFVIPIVPAQVETITQNLKMNSQLSILEKEMEISQKNISLSKGKSLPLFHAGYMSENIVGESFKGVTLGISIPLWQNKNTVKLAKSTAISSQYKLNDKKNELYIKAKEYFEKAYSLQKSLSDYNSGLITNDHRDLLKLALDKGEISLLEYIYEISFYYETIQTKLRLERELCKTMAQLNHLRL